MLAIAGTLALLPPPAASAFSLEELAQHLAAVSQSIATFDETKTISTLTEPLTRQGTLRFERPDRLEMQVTRPYPERIEIAGDTLTIETRRGRSQASLATQPALAAWVTSLRATLAGDTASLTSHFDVALTGDAAHWTLRLVPRDAALRARVKRIEMAGAGARISRYEIDEVNGDRTVLDITPLAGSRR